jgi:mRNA interferase MazF
MAGFDNRSGFTFGDTLLASYVLPGQSEVTPQPCVIVSSDNYNLQRTEVLVMAVAVQDRPNAISGEMSVLHPEAAGLDKGSAFRPMLATVEQRLVRLILGHLEERDRQRLRQLLNLILGV